MIGRTYLERGKPADFDFEVWQDGIMVASVSAPRLEDARREAWHYAMVYAQDGPVEIKGAHADKLMDWLPAKTPPASSGRSED